MAINKPFDRFFTTIGGAVKTSGGTLTLAKGQLALVDLSKTSVDGAVVLGTLAGYPKDKKALAIREGIEEKLPNRSYSNMGKSSAPFSLEEVKKLRVSAPERTEQSVDEVIIGYDGFDASKAFTFKTGDRYFNLALELTGGPLQYRGAISDKELVLVNVEIPDCDPYNTCENCDTCDSVDCKAITLEAIERLKRKQLAGGIELQEFVEITPVFSCDNPATATLIPYTYYSLSLCDTGDGNALALVQAQYNYPVRLKNRVGSTSTYEMLLPDSVGAPDAFSQGIASLIKGCEDCPAGYTESPEGYLYAITIEDDGTNYTTQITNNLASAKYVANTLVKSGNSAGVGFYTAIYSQPITAAEIASFVGTSTNARNTATIDLVGQVAAICDNSTVSTTGWVAGDSCNAVEERYSIVLPDTKCGENRLAELQGNYAGNTIYSFNSSLEVTLTGASGTANINIGGVNYLVTFDTDLTTTADNFEDDHAAAILAATGVGVSAAAGVLTFEGQTYFLNSLGVTNATGNLDADLGDVTAVWNGTGCQNKYETLVISNLVCEECSPVFLDYYVTERPATFDLVEWASETSAPSTPYGNCLCGIRFKGKMFYLEGDEALRDLVGFTETSTKVRVAGGYPSEIREGIGSLPQSTYAVTPLSRFIPRTHLAGNLLPFERESNAYFLDRKYYPNYQRRILRGETSNFSDLSVQFVDYVVEVGHEAYTQGFGGTNSKNIEYHIYAQVGKHQDIEDLLNDLAANAGKKGVQAFGS